MGIDRESDVAANLVIGPTSEFRVRIYVEAEGVDLPMDFEPEEALEIAEELRAAAMTAQKNREGRKGSRGRSGAEPSDAAKGEKDKPSRRRR